MKDFEQLFRNNFNRLCLKAYSLTGDFEIARDIVQEVFMNLWMKRETLVNVSSMEAYLYQSVIHLTLTHLRRHRSMVSVDGSFDESVPTERSVEDNFLQKELEANVKNAIDHLPPGCRQVFMLHRQEQMTYTEIATHLSLSVNSVEKHMSRALRLLRQYLRIAISLLLFS